MHGRYQPEYGAYHIQCRLFCGRAVDWYATGKRVPWARSASVSPTRVDKADATRSLPLKRTTGAERCRYPRSGGGRPPSGVPNTQDDHVIPHDLISNNIRIHGQTFPHSSATYGSAALRKTLQAVASTEEGVSQMLCRTRVVFHQAVVGTPYIAHGGNGPDNAHGLGLGWRNALPARQCSEPLLDPRVGKISTSAISRHGRRIQTRLMLLVRLHVEDRLRLKTGHAGSPSTQTCITHPSPPEAKTGGAPRSPGRQFPTTKPAPSVPSVPVSPATC